MHTPVKYEKPNIVLSRCLELDHCRYNGEMILNKFIRKLMPFVTFIPVCPEVAIGLGIPRDPIRLVGKRENIRLIQPSTERDITEEMQQYSRSFTDQLGDVDGFILKSRSPSCGAKGVKVYPTTGKVSPAFSSSGLFAAHILKKYLDLPVEEEVRFNDVGIREHWLTSIFTLAVFRKVSLEGSMKALTDFQARYKLLFMAYNQTLMRQMGNILANHDKKSFEQVCSSYAPLLRKMFIRRPRYTSNINVHMHAFGYFSKYLGSEERSFFLDLLDQYRDDMVPLSVVNNLLKSWIIRFKESYLDQQIFFNPFPTELTQIEITPDRKRR